MEGLNARFYRPTNFAASCKQHDSKLYFLLMNSFSTSRDTLEFLKKYPALGEPSALQLMQKPSCPKWTPRHSLSGRVAVDLNLNGARRAMATFILRCLVRAGWIGCSAKVLNIFSFPTRTISARVST